MSNQTQARPEPYAEPQATGWVGRVAFASFMLMLGGAWTALMGFFAIINDNWTEWNNNASLIVDATAWGWWNLILGVLVIAVGAALMRGSMFARTVAVIASLTGLLSAFLFIPVMPVWSLTIIVVNFLVIWAVVVHGGEVKDM